MRAYREATIWVCDMVENWIDDQGRFISLDSTFVDSIRQFSNLVQLRSKSVMLRCNVERELDYYWVEPSFAVCLLRLAYQEGEFFDYLSEICTQNLEAGVEIQRPLNYFASDVLCGSLVRPTKRSRPRKKNWSERFCLWHLTQEIVDMFDLKLTRNDEGSNRNSACDALAEGLTVCGRKTQYTEIKNLMVHPDYSKLRSEFEVMTKISDRWTDLEVPQDLVGTEVPVSWTEAAKADVVDILSVYPLSGIKKG